VIRTAAAVRRGTRVRRASIVAFLAVMGPGIITGFAGNDAGGVTTYTAVGAHYGFAMLWLLLLSTAGLLIIQEMCARMGAVTGKGLSDLIRERFGVRWTIVAMVALLIANGSNVVAEFAGVDALANDSTQQLEPAGHDFISVELCEIGKLVELTEDETVDRAEDRRADELPIAAHCVAQLLGWCSLPDRLLAPLDRGDGSLPDHFAEELFLVGEVKVDSALGDSGAVCDVLESGVGESAFAENLEGGLDDLLGPVLRSSTPFWLCCLRFRHC
jgi:hypothetical protein